MTTPFTRISVLLFLILGASCVPEEPADEHGHHDEDAGPASRAASAEPSVPLEGLRGISVVVAPEPRAEGAWFPAEAIGDESASAVPLLMLHGGPGACWPEGLEVIDRLARDRLVVLLGMDHVVVVDTSDALLVADLRRSQEVRDVVDELQRRGLGAHI